MWLETAWTQRVVDGIAKSGKPVAGYAIDQNSDHKVIWAASRQAKEFVHWASEKQRVVCSIYELWVSVKCGESDTTSGLASNPTVDNFIDKMDAWGATTCFGETSEITGAEMVVPLAAKPRLLARSLCKHGRRIWTKLSSRSKHLICLIASQPKLTSKVV